MDLVSYILDSNAVSDYVKQFHPTTARIEQAIRAERIVYLCQPVKYEVLRGLMKVRAERQRKVFEDQFAPQLISLSLIDADWRLAAQFWAEASAVGKQLSDVDLLIAALAHRLGAVIVSDDEDFDALPVQRENWRQASGC